MQGLETQKYHPSFALQTFIDTYWSLQNSSSKSILIPIVPDGCMDLVYQKRQWMLVGAMSESKIMPIEAGDDAFGIRFRPSVLPQLLHIEAHILTDRIVPLAEVSPSLHYQLDRYGSDEAQKVILLDALFESLCKATAFHQPILDLVDHITLHQGVRTMRDLENYAKLSSRQIERLFKHFIGYTPKKFCTILRFFTVFKEVIKNDISNFSAIAYDFGYCDQSHFNKEFKKFSQFFPTHEIMSVFYKTKASFHPTIR
ncbi:AraC family transcriptional regulator [Sulfurospirillum cavolei]|uniref:AraC family transcriptional regulator n=1 Tax=Sulfurospirillum cavolei TaxID=366522 RepID=UPI003FA2C6DA